VADLSIAEVLYETGEIHFRYARYLSSDGRRWIRHGRFTAYHPNGKLASEGEYVHGTEHGLWRDYHATGALAAEGDFENGEQKGTWRYWNEDGSVCLSD
jgi:antitoxin component YwqK of YwqJK toxin-antitoxin module